MAALEKKEHDEEHDGDGDARIPETPPMRIFSSAARASLRDSHAIDLFPYRRLIPVSACGAFLPSFLLLSLCLFVCVSQHELRNLGPITRQ